MEKKMKMKKQHKKHGHQDDHVHRRPLNAYELYEREHMPNMLVKLPSYDHRRAHDYPEVGPPRSHNERIFRPDYYETGRTFYPPSDGRVFEQNIDAEAEKFIRLEHERFEPSKWM